MPSLLDWQREWRAGRVSNYEYLMHLNRAAGRSFNDLAQYPVFPWVLADYESEVLDLEDANSFRDLSKPVGALNDRRLKDFLERYRELKKMADELRSDGFNQDQFQLKKKRKKKAKWKRHGRRLLGFLGGVGGSDRKRNKKNAHNQNNGSAPVTATAATLPEIPPPFMYGCHYSSPGYVVFYLMRWDPKLMLRLQNGRLDAPDRLFWSVADTWKSVLSLPSDVKELTPEFYANDPTFLVGQNGQTFGVRSGGAEVGPVILPRWARDAPDFLQKMAAALESRHVSANLHRWIDLVFGCKSRGIEAERSCNVFHYLTYDEM